MKAYVNPEMMLIELANEDILTISGVDTLGLADEIGYNEFQWS